MPPPGRFLVEDVVVAVGRVVAVVLVVGAGAGPGAGAGAATLVGLFDVFLSSSRSISAFDAAGSGVACSLGIGLTSGSATNALALVAGDVLAGSGTAATDEEETT